MLRSKANSCQRTMIMPTLWLSAFFAAATPAAAGPAIGHDIAEFDAEYAVKPYLNDPDSAKFSNVHGSDVGPWSVICGFVNARNGFGGYMGDEAFVVIVTSPTETEVHFASRTKRRDFQKLWVMCG